MDAARPKNFREDIAGLRGIAVLLVVAYHAFAFPSGGYVGVDVFFVLSGFLITGILLRDLQDHAQLSIARFYVRRARRVLPAALVVLGVTCVAAALVWFAPRAVATWWDAVASLSFVENVRLIRTGADYLQSGAASSPLQHFWSLAVEEQFYAVWPLLLLMAVPILRRWLPPRGGVAVCAGLMIAGSIAWAVVSATTRPDASYFDPVVRAWELGAGALLATAAPVVGRLPRWLRESAFVLGLVAIVLAACVLDDGAAFPRPGAALPVVGTVLVLGTGASVVAALPLRWRGLRYLGRTSYSLYLWHLPVLVVAASLAGPSPLVALLAVGISFLFAVLTERYVERPFLRPSARRSSPVRGPGSLALGGLVTTVLVLAAGVQWMEPSLSGTTTPARAAIADRHDRSSAIDPADLSTFVARGLTEPPDPVDVEPGIDLPARATVAPALVDGGCKNDLLPDELDDPSVCSWGDDDAPRTAVVVGESIALSWTPAIVDALGAGWRIEAMGFASCSMVWTPGQTSRAVDHTARCATARDVMRHWVDDRRPDLVFTSTSEGSFRSTEDATSVEERWYTGAVDGYRQLAGPGRTVVALGAPPEGAPVDACATRFTGVSACSGALPTAAIEKDRAEASAVATLVASGQDARHVAVLDWFCTVDGACPATIDRVLVRSDSGHMTGLMSGRLALVLRDALGSLARS